LTDANRALQNVEGESRGEISLKNSLMPFIEFPSSLKNVISMEIIVTVFINKNGKRKC
jgi:hypothetical protein